MALLNDAQRAVLQGIADKTTALEAETQRLDDLLREVARRDNDSTAMNPGTETGATLIDRAKTAYAVRRSAILAAANALPILP